MIFWSNKNFLKADDLLLFFLPKKSVFILGVAHADPFVVQIGVQKAIYRGFTNFFSELLDCNRS